MAMTCRWRLASASLCLATIGLWSCDRPAFAGWPPAHHRTQVVYATPVAQAPATYTAQAPVVYTAQAPVMYTAQAPTTYTMVAAAPVATAAAPVSTAGAPVTAAAPGTAGAPSEQGIRISHAARMALYSDLVAFYHSEDSGDTRVEKIRAVRERARDEFSALLEGEDDPDPNSSERQDLNTLVDWVISGGAASGGQRTYYAPLQPPGPTAAAPTSGAPASGYMYPVVVGAPTVLVPVKLKPVHHPYHYYNRTFFRP
jgi:hypothetical protein